MTSVNTDHFRSPPTWFRPGVMYPVLCADDLEGLEAKFADLKNRGIGWVSPSLIPVARYGKYTGSALAIDYDTPEYWRAIQSICEAAKAVRLTVVLRDEPGWPSGQAGGKLVEHGGPAWIRKVLRPSAEDPLHFEALEKGSINPDTPQPDLLNPAVGRAVIEEVHERHKNAFGGKWPEELPWIYADEPTYGGIGHDPVDEFIWTDGLEEQFAERYGYRIEAFLPALTSKSIEPLPRETARARVDYFDLIAHLFEENYLKPVFDWCQANGVASGGHFLLEHDPRRFQEGGHGHLMRSLRWFHIPGLDSIFRESHPLERSHHFPKYVSSVARQTGRTCSSMPLAASSCAVTPAVFKWTLDHELVRGIQLFLPWGYSPNPDIRYQWSRPVLGHFGPLWKTMDVAYGYVARLSYLLSLGRPDCTIAIYFDMRSIWAGEPWQSRAIAEQESIARQLSESQHDFDFVDDQALQEATVLPDGRLRVGEMTYDTLILAETEWMEEKARRVVDRLIESGGNVRPDAQLLRPLMKTAQPQPGLRVCKRILESENIYFLVNEGNHPIDTTAIFDEQISPLRLNPEDGSQTAEFAETVDGRIQVPLVLQPWESRVYLFGPASEAQKQAVEQVHPHDGPWEWRVLERTVIDGDRITTIPADSHWTIAKLGDWCESLGMDFTGTVLYKTQFVIDQTPGTSRWKVDLGDVRYACTVTINGHPLGRKLWAPFVFELDDRFLQETNVMEVEVSNTLSNLFASSAYLDRVDQLYSPEGARYVRILEQWEKETRSSGLFGPVQFIRAETGATDPTALIADSTI